jgi:hypothetical protein
MRLVYRNGLARQTVAPVAERFRRDTKRRAMDLARPRASPNRSRPAVEGEKRSGLPGSGPVEEMIRLRIIHVNCDLDEAQPQNPGVEVKVLLGIAGDGGDVVDAQNG